MQATPNVTLESIRTRMLNNILWALVIIGGVATTVAVINQINTKEYGPIPLYLVSYTAVIIVSAYRSLGYNLRAFTCLVLIYGVGLSEFYFFGVTPLSYSCMYALVIFSGLLYGFRMGLASLFLALVSILAQNWNTRYINTLGTGEPVDVSGNLLDWISPLIAFTFLAVMSLIALTMILRHLDRSLRDTNKLVNDLRGEVADRKQAEEAHRESEGAYQDMFNSMTDGLIILDYDGKTLDVNPAMTTLYGYSRDELLSMHVTDVVRPDYHYVIGDFMKQIADTGSFHGGTVDIRKDGSEMHMEIHGSTVLREGKTCYLGIVRDVTERKQAEEELRESQERMELALRGAELGIWEWNTKAGTFMMSERSAEMLGYTWDEIKLWPWEQVLGLCHPEDRQRRQELWDAHEEGKTDSYEIVLRLEHKTGCYVWVVDRGRIFERFPDGKALRVCGTYFDITEHRLAEEKRAELETQLIQSQKLESVGMLAGGIAHDFNNLLQAILGYGDMAMDKLATESPVHDDIEQIIKAGERARVLVQQLLAFSRRQVLELSELNMDQVIADLLKMMHRVIGAHITLDFVSSHDLGTVRADRGQIEQILTNLCVNARDAMGEGGTLTIETSNTELDDEFCETNTRACPGRYVLLSVRDTGCGMDKETQQRIFEPFFTTKEEGKGTGLGLSTVFGIVSQHNGIVDVESQVGVGTTFKIYLPSIEAPVSTDEEEKDSFSQGGTETILLADDDEVVRSITEIMLREAGYSVIVACEGEEAIRAFDKHADEIHLALLDVVMPNLGGKAVAEHILKQHPKFPVLFCSGYSNDAIHTNFVLDDGRQLIQKPYHRDELLRKVRQVIEN